MKTKVNPDLLAACLADVEEGRSTVEECVAAHPDVADELLPLLEIVAAMAPLQIVAPDPAFRAQARMSLIAAISAQENTVTTSFLRRFWDRTVDGWLQPRQVLIGRMTMPAVIIFLVVTLTTAAGGGAVYASQDSLPGDALYQVKTTVEGMQLTLATSDEAKAQTYLELAAKRLTEAQTAAKNGNPAAATSAMQAFAEDVTQSDKHLAQAAASGKDVSGLTAQLSENLARQQGRLDDIKERAPESAKAALTVAMAATQKGLENANARIKDRKNGDSPTATPTPLGGGTVVTPTVTVPTATAVVTATATPTMTAPITSTLSVTFTQTISDVEKLASDPNVPGQSYNGLLAKLNSAQAALERGQPQVAAQVLDAFLNELNAMQQSGHISAENYNKLFANYKTLVAGLNEAIEADAKSTRPSPGSGRAVGKPEGTTDPTTTPVQNEEKNNGRSQRDPGPPAKVTPPTATPVPAAVPSSEDAKDRPSPKPNGDPNPPKSKK